MRNQILLIFVCIFTAILSLGAVSAVNTTDSGIAINSHIKTSDTTNNLNNTKATYTEVIYFTRKSDGKKFSYRATTHTISFTNVYTNFAMSWGDGGYLQFYKSNGSWYRKASGNMWAQQATIKLSSQYNSYSALQWESYLYNYYRVTLKNFYINSGSPTSKLFHTSSKTSYDSYYKTYIYYTWKAYKTDNNHVTIYLDQKNKYGVNKYTITYTKSGTQIIRVSKEKYGTFTKKYQSTLSAVDFYYKNFRNSIG